MALRPPAVVGLKRAILQVDLDGLTRDLGKIDPAVPLALALPDNQALAGQVSGLGSARRRILRGGGA